MLATWQPRLDIVNGSGKLARRPADPISRVERLAMLAVEGAARAYATFTHGNMSGSAYRAREEARDVLLDALARLDVARGMR